MEGMFDKLEKIEARFEEITRKLGEPAVVADQGKFQPLAKEHSELAPIVEAFRAYKDTLKVIEEDERVLREEGQDEDLRALAEEELGEQKARREKLLAELRRLMLPRDPADEKNVILEIRAGTGGEEAALFSADLFRMYSRFAERKGWRVELLSASPTGMGGYKEVIALIEGKRVFSQLRSESGTHRVQRVPVTESQGRIHTSAVTVAVLPEAEEVEVKISPDDLRVDVFRSSGPGGQSVNTTDSAVRITHLPTGIVVSCQDEKSQHKNRAKALKILRARLLDLKQREQQDRRSQDRRAQVGSGDRSERIRTYNFPQNRVTDHRVNLTLYKLDSVLQGELEELMEAVMAAREAERLVELETAAGLAPSG